MQEARSAGDGGSDGGGGEGSGGGGQLSSQQWVYMWLRPPSLVARCTLTGPAEFALVAVARASPAWNNMALPEVPRAAQAVSWRCRRRGRTFHDGDDGP
eukprot:4114584-Prymnesium_polylepis.1